jgi:BirA family biotin operon repressor/biotin-[acetyl-CoA-carboxylase] ligase
VDLDQIAPLASRLQWSASTGSTNTDLVSAVQADPAAWPEFSVLGTDFQTGGRGRSGRVWQAPAGSSLFVSVLLKPPVDAAPNFGWLPLLAGLAARDALTELGLSAVGVKWPNDVLVGELKIAGVLSEFVPKVDAVVVGMGLNLTQSREELPVETATSMRLAAGQNVAAEGVLAGYLKNFRAEYDRLVAANFDADTSGLRAKLLAASATVGRPVRAILPGDTELLGTATDIDAGGRLVISHDGASTTLAAGDIVHLRHSAAS